LKHNTSKMWSNSFSFYYLPENGVRLPTIILTCFGVSSREKQPYGRTRTSSVTQPRSGPGPTAPAMERMCGRWAMDYDKKKRRYGERG